MTAVVDPPMTDEEMESNTSAAVYLGVFVQKALKAEVFRLSQEQNPQ